MRTVNRLLVIALVGALLGGCANFDTIRAFAKDGSAVAAAARKDVEMFAASCAELKSEAAVLAYAGGASSVPADQSSTCKNVMQASQVASESLSVQLLIKYHEALNALAGDPNWSLAKEIEALGSEVKKIQMDGKALSSPSDVDRYQRAFAGIANLTTSALREREAKRLLGQELGWAEVLRPLRFWYGGPDGKSVSLYSQACRIIRTDWSNVQSELMDYARCDRKTAAGVPACEPLTAGARLVAIDSKIKPVASCAPGSTNELPPAAVARVRLIDGWLEAHEELRRKAFENDVASLQERLAALREQVDAIKKAFD
jgi:hypothetical protein